MAGTMINAASIISIPFGILAAIYLAVLDPYSRIATLSRFLAKTLTGLPSILTGVMLALAGAAGESAPLLFTALFSNYYIETLPELMEPTASLSILIYHFSAMSFDNQIELAWTASLVLVLIVLAFNILPRLIGQPKV